MSRFHLSVSIVEMWNGVRPFSLPCIYRRHTVPSFKAVGCFAIMGEIDLLCFEKFNDIVSILKWIETDIPTEYL